LINVIVLRSDLNAIYRSSSSNKVTPRSIAFRLACTFLYGVGIAALQGLWAAILASLISR
jgi:hypothetical protein